MSWIAKPKPIDFQQKQRKHWQAPCKTTNSNDDDFFNKHAPSVHTPSVELVMCGASCH